MGFLSRALLLATLIFTSCSSEPPDPGTDPDASTTVDTGAVGDAGPGADGSTPGDGAMPMGERPVFSGPTVVYAEGPTEVVLAWVAAVDDVTPPEAILYRVYMAADAASAEALADAGGPGTSEVTGETTTSITGLVAATQYAFVVIAEDTDGHKSVRRPARTVLTPATAMQLVKTVKVLSELGLTVTPTDLDHFDVSGANIGMLVVGDIVIAENSFGRSLVRIAQITPNAAGVALVTEKAGLDDVVRSGELHLSGVLPDASAFEGGSFGPGRYARYRDPRAGITLEQRSVDHVFLGPVRHGVKEENVSLEQDVSLDYAFTWEVGYEANVVWRETGVGLPESVTVLFTGKLGVEGEATYSLEGMAQYETEKELLSRTLTFTYVVGGVPVIQQVTLKVMAKLEMKAEAEFKAGVDFNAEKEVRIGFTWYNGQGFNLLKDDGFTQETNFTLEGEASASAKLSIYPVVSTTFYGVATGAVTVDPTVELEAHARFLPLPVELDKFNVDFSVGLQLSADLSAFGKTLEKWEGERHELLRVPVFSLPELKLLGPSEATICHPAKLSLLVSDGYANHVTPERILWVGPDISPAPSSIRADLMATAAGTRTVEVSAYGDGLLGVLGTRHATLEIEVTDPGVDCSMVPVPGQGNPIACVPTGALESAITAPPYFTKTRTMPGDNAQIMIPLHTARPMVLEGSFLEYHESILTPILGRVPGIHDEMEQPFDGEYPVDFVPINVPPGRYTWAQSLKGEPQCDPIEGYRVECQFLTIENEFIHDPVTFIDTEIPHADYYENSAWFGPNFDPITGPERDGCQDWSGIPKPAIYLVAPEAPHDRDNDAAHAIEFAHGVRARGALAKADKDFYRYTPHGAGSPPYIYDQTRPTPDCFVEVRADGNPPNPPVLITVYQGEVNAGSEGASVVEGNSPVRFLPDPTKVYFARFKYRDPDATGEYVAEIKSDCTAETPFPLLTGEVVVSSTVPTYQQTIQVTVPVNMLTRSVWVDLMQAVDVQPWGAGRASVDVPNGATEVVVDVYVNNGGFPLGQYYVQVMLGDATLINSQSLLSTYGRNSSISTTSYTLKKENFIAGTSESSDSGLPIVYLTPGPP